MGSAAPLSGAVATVSPIAGRARKLPCRLTLAGRPVQPFRQSSRRWESNVPRRARQIGREQACRQRPPVCSASPDSGSSQSGRTFASGGTLPGQFDFQPGTLLGGRYEVLEVLGRGGNGVTYRCRSTESGTDVAVKCLSLRSLKDWKQLELFEREAQILKNLEHRGIPRYLDYFEQDTEQDRAFFLVQEEAKGKSLAEMVGSGWRADEEEVTRIASELLAILQYLGSRRPPVIHRDVKPENIVVEGGKAGGRVFLVDFGGVQAAASSGADTLLGSTIVGTYGYMAPEQFRGAATTASDLYGLGGTLLYLLSGRPPSAFPVARMRTDFSAVAMGSRLEAVVEGLLEPLPEDRLSAEDALGMLSGTARAAQRAASSDGYGSAGGSSVGPRPAGSKIVVKRRGARLEIDIPPSGFSGSTVTGGAFALAWNSFVAFWTISAVAGGGLLFGLFSLPFWAAGFQLAKQALGRSFMRERLVITPNSWKIEQQLAFARKGQADWDESKRQRKEVGGRAADLTGASIETPMIVNGEPQYQLVLQEGINRHVLGEGLDLLEQEWLVNTINQHLAESQGRELGAGRTRQLGAGAERGSLDVRQTYTDFLRSAEEEAARAGAAARATGRRAERAAQRAAQEAAADVERAAGRFSGSRFGRRQQQQRQFFDDDDDDMFRSVR